MKFIKTVELRHDDPIQTGKLMKDLLINTKVVKATPGWHIPDLRKFYDEATEYIGQFLSIGEDFKNEGRKQEKNGWR
jgi:hypothetical protein